MEIHPDISAWNVAADPKPTEQPPSGVARAICFGYAAQTSVFAKNGNHMTRQ